MDINNYYSCYLHLQQKHAQLVRDARREHLLRIALQPSPKIQRSFRDALTTLITSLFRS